MLPMYMAIGVSFDKFMDSNPKELEPFVKAHELRRKQIDEQMWVMGLYVQSAVATSIEHCLAGSKAKSEYIKEPLLSKAKKDNGVQSDDDVKRKTDLLFTKLNLMKANFDLTHKGGAET